MGRLYIGFVSIMERHNCSILNQFCLIFNLFTPLLGKSVSFIIFLISLLDLSSGLMVWDGVHTISMFKLMFSQEESACITISLV